MRRITGLILLSLVLLGGTIGIMHGAKPDAKTIWTNATPGNRLEPGGSKKNTGYVAGERPGFKTWNWLIYNLGIWTDYLEDVTDLLKISSMSTGGYMGQTGDIGIGTSTPTAKVHIVSTGTGTDVAFQIDTAQQASAVYISSTGVVEIASMTVVEQTVTNQTITNQTVTNLAVSSAVVTDLTATNIKNTQLDSANSAINVLTSTQVTVTPGSAIVAVTIDQNENEIALKIDCEATTANAVEIYGAGTVVTQDISNGFGLRVARDIAEVGGNPLVKLQEVNGASTQPVLEISNVGSGEYIKLTPAVVRYYAISHHAFHGRIYTDEQARAGGDDGFLRNIDGGFAAKVFTASVNLPHEAIVTSWTMHYQRTEGVIDADLKRSTLAGGAEAVMGDAIGTDTGGSAHSVTDASINNATIDNVNYAYVIVILLDNVDATDDVTLYGFSINYIITIPLP